MKTSDLYCAATIAGGVITLENGRQIDLAAIERALKCIVSTEYSWYEGAPEDTLEEILVWTKTALDNLTKGTLS